MDVTRLREATAADHEAVEGAVPLMDAGLSLERYVAVLQRMYGVVKAWEEFALAAASPALRPLAIARQRKALLEADLRVLGASIPTERGPKLPEWHSEPELLGAMYVMEGSRLGGQMIARHVEAVLGLPAAEGSAYFRGFAEKTGAMWKEFVSVLGAAPQDGEEEAIAAAKEVFRVFGGWMAGVEAASSL